MSLTNIQGGQLDTLVMPLLLTTFAFWIERRFAFPNLIKSNRYNHETSSYPKYESNQQKGITMDTVIRSKVFFFFMLLYFCETQDCEFFKILHFLDLRYYIID